MRTFEFFIPVKPVPASRPRVTRWGTYFTKTYTDFRNECYRVLKPMAKKYPANDAVYAVEIIFVCRRPKSPANEYPVGDVDNYLKGILDALVHCGLFFKDDTQIVELKGTKRYQEIHENPGMFIRVTQVA